MNDVALPHVRKGQDPEVTAEEHALPSAARRRRGLRRGVERGEQPREMGRHVGR